MSLADDVLLGSTRAVARAMTWVENNYPGREELIDALYPKCGGSLVAGITGAPGSGKSTLVDRLIEAFRAKGRKVGIIAVDPSSPFSGGAVLGDRIRMQSHAEDDGVFIRSMASRGHLGGVASATADAVKVLDAAGYDLIILETIGVGQTEIEVMQIADIVALVLVPGLGDEIQAMKAGVMEIGDIFVVNKADRDGAEKIRAEIEYMLQLKSGGDPAPENPVVMTSALQNTGIEELVAALEETAGRFTRKGELEERRRKRIALEIRHILMMKIEERVHRRLNFSEAVDEWVRKISEKRTPPYTLINAKVEQLVKE